MWGRPVCQSQELDESNGTVIPQEVCDHQCGGWIGAENGWERKTGQVVNAIVQAKGKLQTQPVCQ